MTVSPSVKKGGWMRSCWLQLHLWIGWLAALPLVVICVTGLPLAFQQEFEQRFNRENFQPSSSSHRLSLSDALDRMASRPDTILYHVNVPQSPVAAYTAYAGELGPDKKRRNIQLVLNPYTGQLALGGGESRFMRILTDCHRCLAAGPIGKQIVAIASLLLAATSLIGIVLWWPMKGRTFVRAWRRGKALDWHNAVGLVTLVPLCAMAITGITFTWGNRVFPALSRLQSAPLNPRPISFVSQKGRPMLPLGKVALRVEAEFPQDAIIAVQPAASSVQPHVFLMKKSDDGNPSGSLRVFMNPVTGQAAEVFDFSRTGLVGEYQQLFGVLHTMYPFNILIRATWGLLSLSGAVLAVTGLWMTLRRRRATAIRQGRPNLG